MTVRVGDTSSHTHHAAMAKSPRPTLPTLPNNPHRIFAEMIWPVIAVSPCCLCDGSSTFALLCARLPALPSSNHQSTAGLIPQSCTTASLTSPRCMGGHSEEGVCVNAHESSCVTIMYSVLWCAFLFSRSATHTWLLGPMYPLVHHVSRSFKRIRPILCPVSGSGASL